MAELVGPTGTVIGVDYSAAQVEQARALLPAELSNVRFVEASATDTGLPREAFDLAEMRRLAKDESVLAIMPRMSQVWASKPKRWADLEETQCVSYQLI